MDSPVPASFISSQAVTKCSQFSIPQHNPTPVYPSFISSQAVTKCSQFSIPQHNPTPVYPSFHLPVLWAEVVSNPRCLSVIHTLHFSLLYSYLTQCFKQLYSQLIFTQNKIVTNESTTASSSSAIAFCLNSY